jgi:hypothetical protein
MISCWTIIFLDNIYQNGLVKVGLHIIVRVSTHFNIFHVYTFIFRVLSFKGVFGSGMWGNGMGRFRS